MLSLQRSWKRPWALLYAGLSDLRHPPAGNRPCLDALRSAAVVLVLLYHVRIFAPHAVRTLRMPFTQFGWTGVDLFFVLSGLLIGGQLWKELQVKGTIDVPRFILRRGFRIWPFYYSLVALMLVEWVLFKRHGRGLWLDATFLSNYYSFFSAGGHQVAGGWSLSMEEQFYFLIPILFALCARFASPRLLVNLAIGWLIVLPLIRYLTTLGMHDPLAIRNAIYYPFHTHSDGLAVGLLIAWLLTWKPEVLHMGRWLDVALVIICVAGFCLWYAVSPIFLFSTVAIAYGALTLSLLRLGEAPLFRSPIFYVISRLSFGVYLIHPGVMGQIESLHLHIGSGFKAFACAFLLVAGLSFVVAFFTFSWIELPFMKLRDSLLAKSYTAGPARA